MATKKADAYANIAVVQVLESAPATQTTAKFAFPFSIMDKMALVISRLEYWIPQLIALNHTQDMVYCALTCASSVVTPSDQSDPRIIDNMSYTREDLGGPATGSFRASPFVKDFANLPGGGLLVAPNPLYALIQGIGSTPAMLFQLKMFYTYIELSTDEYWQLVESRRIISV